MLSTAGTASKRPLSYFKACTSARNDTFAPAARSQQNHLWSRRVHEPAQAQEREPRLYGLVVGRLSKLRVALVLRPVILRQIAELNLQHRRVHAAVKTTAVLAQCPGASLCCSGRRTRSQQG